ncbi:uncharacterized protein N7459_008808 [Penicillium hispanicum]|uniref:uncharacterized protein n=1 Tax=Penicillium hispanicum TaxID=1080232 RepID=UPI00253FF54F|nr:uncharacterized protein N7459_008808 [Penicillium hispanicum]KAJ5574381.1 hypothetical protein N7459_008808 [Penicillium hispanicum]
MAKQPSPEGYGQGYEQTLPVLSRPPATTSWTATDPTPHSGAYHVAPHPTTLAPGLPSTSTAVQRPDSKVAPLTPAMSTAGTERNASSKVRKPRKAANSSAGKSTLFWVNSDPQTASTGTKEETLKRIRSHVMSEHNRKKRLESTKKYKPKTWKNLAFQPPETIPGAMGPPRPPVSSSSSSSSPDSRRSSYAIDQSDIKQELVPVATTTAMGYHSAVLAEAWDGRFDDTFDEVVGYASRPAAPSVWAYVGSGAHDPFNTGHTQMTDRMMRHLQNFLWDLTQEAHPLQVRYKPKLQAHWATLIQRDPAILHATICMSTSNAAMQRGELPIRDPNQHRSALVLDTFHHRGETIRLVNEGLSDPVKAASDELIAAVSTLLTIEIASGNPDYLKIHLAGLRQMIGLRKNFADVPPDIRFQISWTDIRVACMAMTKPIFAFVRSLRPAGFSLLPPTDDVALMATRLVPLMKIPGIFDDAFAQTIYDLLELSWYAEWIKGSTGYKEFDDDTEDYFNFEVLYVEYSLHAGRYTPIGQVKNEHSIEGCCRLACLCFHNSAIWTFYPMLAPLLPKPILTLRAALEATIPTGLFGLCRDLLIWLLFMGAICSQAMPSERAYFVSELVDAARLHGVNSWQEARSILQGFFYTDRVHLPMLRQVWHEVQMQVEPIA